MRKLVLVVALLVLTGCAAMNSAMTPSVRTEKSQFDGSVSIIQAPVSAASSIKEDWHTLGFRWTDTDPEYVFILAGVPGIQNVMGVDFKVGQEYITAESASSLTDYRDPRLGRDWSTRQFILPLHVFRQIATADTVQMRVRGINTYTLSSFGTSTSATVGEKFSPFLSAVDEAR